VSMEPTTEAMAPHDGTRKKERQQTQNLVLSERSLEFAFRHLELSKHEYDIFPPFIEFRVLESMPSVKKDLIQDLAKLNLHKYKFGQSYPMLTPKSHHGYRMATMLSPLDSILFTAVMYELGPSIMSAQAEVNGEIYSNKFSGREGQLIESGRYGEFIAATESVCKDASFTHVVVADIADFFGGIYHHTLNSTMVSTLDEVGEKYADFMEYDFLAPITMKHSYGIPVGSDAARLLSEICLLPIDYDITLVFGDVKYMRFSDDFRVFCRSKRTAVHVLERLHKVIFERHGMCLQQHKTCIMTSAQYLDYLEKLQAPLKGSFSLKLKEAVERHGLKDIFYNMVPMSDLADVVKNDLMPLEKEATTALEHQLKQPNGIDEQTTQLLLLLLACTQCKDAVSIVLGNIESLHTVFRSVVAYITAIAVVSEQSERADMATKLIQALDGVLFGGQSYHQIILYHAFSQFDWGLDARYFFSCLEGTSVNYVKEDIAKRFVLFAFARHDAVKMCQWWEFHRRDLKLAPCATAALYLCLSYLTKHRKRPTISLFVQKLSPLDGETNSDDRILHYVLKFLKDDRSLSDLKKK